MGWFRGVMLGLTDDEVFTRGRWRTIVGGLMLLATAAFVLGLIIAEPTDIIPPMFIAVMLIVPVPSLADYVAISESEVLNSRSMPWGTSRTDVSLVQAVGWSSQILGFVVPVLVLEDSYVVLTALGQQTLGSPLRQAEVIAERLGVPFVGELPRAGLRSRIGR